MSKKLLLILAILLASLQSQAQWTQLTSAGLDGFSGEDPGAVYRYNNFLFAGTPGGVFRSDLSGSTWTNMSNGIYHESDTTLNVNMFTSNTGGLYATTGYSIRKSVDNGATWVDASQNLLFSSPKRIIKFVTFKNNLYIFRHNGTIINMHRSADSAKTWQTILYTLYPQGESVAATPSKLYVVDEDTLRASTDGLNFNPIVTNLPADMQTLTGDDNYLYATAGSFIPSIYRLDLTTNTWAQKTTGLPPSGIPGLLQYMNDTLFVTVIDLLTREISLYRSTNHADTWTKVNVSGLRYPVIANMLSVNGTIYGSGTDGFYKSADGGSSWSWASDGIRASHHDNIVVSGDNVFSNSSRGILKSTDKGATFTVANSGLPPTVTLGDIHKTTTALYVKAENLFGDTGFIYRSTDNATTWTKLTLPSGVIMPEIIGDHGPRLYIKSGLDVYKTDDAGGSWSPVTNIGLADIKQIKGTGSQLLFALGDYPDSATFIMESNDDGATWHSGMTGLGPALNTPQLEIAELSAFMIMNDSVFKRSGPTWNQTLMSGLSTVTHITEMDYYRGRLYISTDTGLFYSNYLTGVWNPLGHPVLPEGIMPTNYSINDDHIMIGTTNGAIWRMASPWTGIESVKANAGEFKIYPNPASSMAMIAYESDQNASVSIEVYDITGRIIMTVNTGVQQPGLHVAELNTAALNPGLYHVILKNGMQSSSAKLVVNR